MPEVQVCFYKKNNCIIGFSAVGHAGRRKPKMRLWQLFHKKDKEYAAQSEYGNIVCAGISALLLNTTRSLIALTDTVIDVQSEETGLLRCSVIRGHNEKTALLMESLILGIQEIAREYPKRIRIEIIDT